MALEQTKNDVAGDAQPASAIGEQPRKNEQSTIEFPYNDLDDAVDIAKAIHTNAGLSCTIDQLAAYLKKAVSGPFRVRLSNARMFGVTSNERGMVSLSPLGQRIADPMTEAQARVEAFLNIQLYKTLFENHRGSSLPGVKGIEQEMIALGVSSKQADKARRTFLHSARQAGFFAQGDSRLVAPAFSAAPPPKPIEAPLEEKPKETRNGTGGPPSDLHPFIHGLLRSLPKPAFDTDGSPETEWAPSARAKWLQTAANIFDLIYKGEGGIKIEAAIAQRSPRPGD